MKIKYLISFKYNEPRLTRIIVKSETPTRIYVSSYQALIGDQYLGQWFYKSALTCFDTEAEAVKALIDLATEGQDVLEYELAGLKKTVEVLKERLSQNEAS